VIAIDRDYIGKFAASGGLADLGAAPYEAARAREKFVAFALAQAAGPGGKLAAIPTDIGPGTLLYRKDIIERGGVTEADLTASWESYPRQRAAHQGRDRAYLLAHASDIRDIYVRAGLADGEGALLRRRPERAVESPRFVRAFELGLATRRAGLDANTPHWTTSGPRR
jgi:multiple sugar transport system substrate-binding protein